jgi:hypothetical protein
MKKIMSFLVIAGMLMVGIKTPKAEEVCYGSVCFPDGERSFADSYISYDPGPGAEDCCNKPSAAEGSPNYKYDKDGSYVSLGCYGVLVVKFTDNSLTTSGDSFADLWIFEIGAEVEPTNIDISTDGVNWIEVGSTSGATSGIDIDVYSDSGVVLGEHYSYVRITDRDCLTQSPPYPGADIDAVGAIESADPVTTTTIPINTTTTVPVGNTTTIPSITTSIGNCTFGFCVSTSECTDALGSGWICQSGCCEQVAIITTTTTIKDCPPGATSCGDDCCLPTEPCCIDACCDLSDLCTLAGCAPCGLLELYGEGSVEVDLLRDLRDNVLSQTQAGQEIIELYYQWSPAIVQAMEEDEEFKEQLREMIDGVLELLGGGME